MWVIGNETTTNPSTIPGHTAFPRTTTYQEVVVDSYTNLREKYRCDSILFNGTELHSNEYGPMSECEQCSRNPWPYKLHSLYEVVLVLRIICILLLIDRYTLAAPEVTLSSLTLASRTATTLSVTWSAGYPKCYSFTVSHSTQDGSITVAQPADSDTSHTLISLQPSTTYRIEVEAVRKGDGADRQRAKVVGNFTTGEDEQ